MGSEKIGAGAQEGSLLERIQKARDTAGSRYTTLRNETADEVIAALSGAEHGEHGWVLYGPDGHWHWSSKYDTHESVEDQRPATVLEKCLFNAIGHTTERFFSEQSRPPVLDASHRETVEQFAERIAKHVRRQFIGDGDDEMIVGIRESHMVFAKACVMEAVGEAMRSSPSPTNHQPEIG